MHGRRLRRPGQLHPQRQLPAGLGFASIGAGGGRWQGGPACCLGSRGWQAPPGSSRCVLVPARQNVPPAVTPGTALKKDALWQGIWQTAGLEYNSRQQSGVPALQASMHSCTEASVGGGLGNSRGQGMPGSPGQQGNKKRAEGKGTGLVSAWQHVFPAIIDAQDGEEQLQARGGISCVDTRDCRLHCVYQTVVLACVHPDRCKLFLACCLASPCSGHRVQKSLAIYKCKVPHHSLLSQRTA